MRKVILLFLFIFTGFVLNANDLNKDPKYILNKVYEKLHESASGNYEFTYLNKRLFSTDTTMHSGRIFFNRKDKNVPLFNNFYLEVDNRNPVLKSDTVSYTIYENEKEYELLDNNTRFTSSYDLILDYSKLNKILNDTTFQLLNKGIYLINNIPCSKLNFINSSEEGAMIIDLLISNKDFEILKIIYSIDFMGENQYEEIGISNFKLNNQNINENLFSSKLSDLQENYKLVARLEKLT